MSVSRRISSVVFDIEGTTTPITFVSNVLFPFVRENLCGFFESTWPSEQTQADVSLLYQTNQQDLKDGLDAPQISGPGESDDLIKQTVINNVLWQMDKDRKATALKQLQGHIWQNGYENGSLKGPVYADVVPSFHKLRDLGISIYIYSSGSIFAQKLLFGHSTDGDLLPLFSGHFDTTIGLKVDAMSYGKIATAINVPAEEILFLTDSFQEAKAATEAGFNVRIAEREGNAPLPAENPFKTVLSFDQLFSDPEFSFEKN